MRLPIAALLLALFCLPAFGQEPAMEHRFGPGPHFLQKSVDYPRASKRARQSASVKRSHGKLARPVDIPQTHERVAAYAGSLISSMRSEMGTNPTGWRNRWCAYYLRTKLPATVASKVDNRAISFLNLRRVGKEVGAIAVMRNHVGVVEGFDSHGNPIIISGNHSRRVGRGVYSSGRILAYVSAS